MKWTFQEVYERFPDRYHKFNEIVQNDQTTETELKILGLMENSESLFSIGAGHGDLELRFCESKRIKLGYLDPNAAYAAAFREKANAKGLGALIAEISTANFESYVPNLEYDTVLSIHSWYTIGENEVCLRKALDCVRAGGSLMITLASASSPRWKICEVTGADKSITSAERLSSFARARGFDHEFFIIHRYVPLAGFIDNETATDSLKALASFLACMPWEELSRTQQEQIKQLVVKDGAKGKVDLASGALLFRR